jgi:hypothetical protein
MIQTVLSLRAAAAASTADLKDQNCHGFAAIALFKRDAVAG